MNAVIVSIDDRITDLTATALYKGGFAQVSVTDGDGIEAIADSDDYALAVFDLTSSESLLKDAAVTVSRGIPHVLICAPEDEFDEILKTANGEKIYVIPRDFGQSFLDAAVHNVVTALRLTTEYNKRVKKAETKLADIKTIERAKWVLAKYLNFSEAEAHRYIQKNAMDRRRPQIEIAKDILRTYEI
ncbi:MAG: ANTAR domain-containing protein [Ruminococcus sp.]|jgi:response regulator NasT|nr:ANTAR domain-containing protein [Ruminococcus sp.]